AIAAPAGAQIIEREFHRGVMEGPMGLDPQYAVRPVEIAVLTDLFMGLVATDASGQPQAGAAESWTLENKGRRWVFKLRQNLKWSDGRPLTADDFVYSFQRLLAPQSVAPFASMFHIIAGAEELHGGKSGTPSKLGVTAKNKQTLVFDLTAPAPYFLSLLTHPAAFPLRQDQIERNADSWTRPGRMVTNGAYILGEWLPGRYIKLRKNWGFHDPASVIMDNVFYDIIDHHEVALERFFAGELHTLSGIPREQIARLMEQVPEAVRLHPTLTVDYLVFNTDKPPFDDVRVRQALALAIDSRSLVDDVLESGEIPITGLLPKGMANWRAPAQPTPTGPRPLKRPDSPEQKLAQAEKILINAGYGAKDSLRLTLHYNNAETHQLIAKAIAGMWKKIGVRTDLYGAHYAVHYGDLGLGEFDIARAGWTADFNDPMAVLELLQSKNERFNYGAFADERFDRLLAQANMKTNPPERAIDFYRAHERAKELFPVVPLYQHASRNLVGATVTGWNDNIEDIHPSRFLNLPD
ncbi:MAG: peptide ABC transporter substrate-binding protein, partial [Alphaproteobacteria bacterium]|nr:peptide ABC transporter substrate-binding protein [Alphaproteobacteria bacterium]